MSPTSPAPHSAPWSTASGMKYLGPHTDTAPLQVTLVLRRRHGALPRSASWPQAPQWPRAEFGRQCGADAADLARLRDFARGHGLNETGAAANRRVLHLAGSPQALERAFGVKLGRYQLADGSGPFVGCDHAPMTAARNDCRARTGSATRCAHALAPTQGGTVGYLHADPARSAVRLSCRHRRQRPGGRDHRARRRLQHRRSCALLHRPRHYPPACGDCRRSRRRHPTSPAVKPTAR